MNWSSGRTPRGRAGGEFDFGVEDQQRRHAVGGGRGVAEIAGDRAAILDLPAPISRGGLQARRRRAADRPAPRSLQVVAAPMSVGYTSACSR
jgi:hypothetical protein